MIWNRNRFLYLIVIIDIDSEYFGLFGPEIELLPIES